MIVTSTDLKVGEKIPVYKPFRLDRNTEGIPIRFEIEFIALDDIRYRYSIEYTREEIIFEELASFRHKQEAILFQRKKGQKTKFGTQLKGRKRNIEETVLPNQLFLSRAANSNHKQLKELYLYFMTAIQFHTRADSKDSPSPLFETTILLKRHNDEKSFKNQVINLLISSDVGISDLELEADPGVDKNKFKFPEKFPEELKNLILEDFGYRPITYHKRFHGDEEIGNIPFDLKEESGGTIKMYDLSGKIVESLRDGSTLVVDELDSSLHPMMSAYIVKLFQDPRTNPNNAQLIAATHDVSLLDPELVGRDQIWFTEKNQFGATELVSLDEFDKNQVRSEVNFGKWYLDGRFGALPMINPNLFKIDMEDEEKPTNAKTREIKPEEEAGL